MIIKSIGPFKIGAKAGGEWLVWWETVY